MREAIALTLVDGIGPSRANLLINEYGSPEEVFRVSTTELHREGHIPLAVAERFSFQQYEREVDTILEWCEQNNVTIILPDSSLYPPLLTQIYDPPTVLYGLGNLNLLTEPSIAVIGMRKLSDYGRKAAKVITDGLCDAGYVITSGLAYGADEAAHEAVLAHHGKTIAVMATGPDRVYPAAHRDLAGRIQERGAILTEYPPGSTGNRYRFVQRNRVVSGMSEATVVLEAAHKSGSLITANFAISQGREVFAVPGSIFSGCSEGTNELIATGATPALSAEQIVKALGGNVTEKQQEDTLESEQLKLFEDTLPEYLSPEEVRVLKSLCTENAQRVDQLIESLDMSFDELFGILLNLEMNTLIEQVPGGGYRRV